MVINLLNIRNSINKAYLKVKPNRTQIETFKKNITKLFDQIKESESEEFHKNIISEFLKNTYYSPDNYINTKGRSDLVIHNGKDSNSPVGVLFEVKKPSNKSEMPTCENINTKAFHELILYYLRERISNKNIEIKHLVITNIFEWFIFNAGDFERLFANDKSLVKQFINFEEGRLSGTNTDFFYKNIAEPFCNNLESDISITHFDIRDFESTIKNTNREDDSKLIALYKIYSPEHLLKLPFANDSNNLDKTFYNELLHIIGLEETKEGNKKLIGRKTEKKRNPGSLIENSITILKYEDCLSQLSKISEFGNNKEEQLFNIALELVITWINRILFLKLLEGQLIKYNNGNKSFRFLNVDRIHDYDELNKLFFQVLAVKETDRSELIKQKFNNIPYLNSSLFEPSDLEHKTIRINSLDNHSKHSIFTGTVLKDNTGKKLTGEIDPLQYLFGFLDSFDFSSEGSEDIQEENKTLINASVLGLIFEKINGYKEGSFFTPGFITMYMCHETIRKAIVQKFNKVKGWKCETISDVYNEVEDIKEANRLINSIRICDPAVGSGHFLVSALNEIIAIKSELKIFTDREGKKLKEYTIEVINDELIITDEQSKLFEYNPKSKESQRVQEALFQEKQNIIENCLFGVDINPNSVKICRLRLWIELLKNAYYKQNTNFKELETLPNIDINIKCGNSLINRYPLDADIKTALKSSKWNIDNYREAVMTYRNAQSKDEKRCMEQLINKIKNDFETEVSKNDKRFLKLNRLNGELLSLTGQSSLFELNNKQKEEWNNKVKKLVSEIKKYETEIEEIKSNKIFENAFEWRFEFPEVLNNDGDFVGFDVVIGNPPYLNVELIAQSQKEYFKERFETFYKRTDIFCLFLELSSSQLINSGQLAFIMPSIVLNNLSYKPIREKILKNNWLNTVCYTGNDVFADATVDTVILILDKNGNQNIQLIDALDFKNPKKNFVEPDFFMKGGNVISISGGFESNSIFEKAFAPYNIPILNNFEIFQGIVTGNNPVYILDERTQWESLRIEPELLHVLLHGRDFNKWIIKNTERRIIYITDDTPIEKFPKVIEYLSKYKIAIETSKSANEKTSAWYALHRPRVKSQLDLTPKIIVQNTRNERLRPRIVATIDELGVYGSQGINFIIPNTKEYTVYFLLGILNSKLINYLFETKFLNLAIKADYLKQLTFPNANIKLRSTIENIVKQILFSKRSDPNKDIIPLEAQIDQLVYELYGLNEEEIQIIES